MSSPTATVSLPSINEMFPEHMLRSSPPHSINVMRPFAPRKSTSYPPVNGSVGGAPAFRVNVLSNDNNKVNQQHPLALLSRPPMFPELKASRIHISPSPYPSMISFPLSGSSSPIITPARSHKRIVGKQDSTYSNSSGEASDPADGSMIIDAGDNTKRHICPTCMKRFNRPSSLRIHVNTHTGATPFRCPYPNCGREFNVNSNMRRHLRNHTVAGGQRSPGDPSASNSNPNRRRRGSSQSDSPYSIGAVDSQMSAATTQRHITNPTIMPSLPSFAKGAGSYRHAPQSKSLSGSDEGSDEDEDESMDDDEDDEMNSHSPSHNHTTPPTFRLQPVSSFDTRSHHSHRHQHTQQSDMRSSPSSPSGLPPPSPSVSSERSSYMRHGSHSPPRDS